MTRRLVDLQVLNSIDLRFVKPKGLVSVFDGHVELEPSCFVAEEQTLRLIRAPAFEVRGLVDAAVI